MAQPAPSTSSVSLLRYSPAAILIAIAITDIQRWADPDLWGHILFGRAMLAHHHIAVHDMYSYSAHWRVWLDHEWLSELVMGAIYKYCGVVGLKLMKFACSAAVIVSLAFALAETDSPPTVQFAILVAVGVAIGPQMQFRPQIFTFALMSCLLAMLARCAYRGRTALWRAVPLMVLWANLHGGFILGLMMLAMFSLVVLVQDLIEGRGIRRGLLLIAVLLTSTLGTLMTPYGMGTWEAVVHATTNSTTRQVIDDWQPLLRALDAMWHRNPGGAIPMLTGLALFLASALIFVLAPSAEDFPLVAIAGLMVAAAFIAMRNLPPAVIACAVPLSAGYGRLFSRHAAPEENGSWMRQLILIAAATGLLIKTGLFSSALRAGSPRPVGAVAFMQEHRMQGNIMTDFAWGEYVIWHMAPGSKVFIDGRYDTIYPPDVIADYLTVQYGRPGAGDVLQKYPHDFFLLRADDAPTIHLLANSHEWKQIYRDSTCILFARADSEAARTAAVAVAADDTPPSYFP